MKLLSSIVVPACLFLAGCAAPAPSGAPPVRQVSVRGYATFIAPEDHVALTVSVQDTGASSVSAMRGLDGRVKSIRTALAKQGIDPADIETSQPNVIATQGSIENPVEATAIANVTATFEKRRDLWKILEAALGAGAAQVVQVRSFRVASAAALETDAVARAYADARSKAETLAALSGVTVGEVMSLSTDAPTLGMGIGPGSGGMRPRGPMVMGVEPDRGEINVGISVVYEIR